MSSPGAQWSLAGRGGSELRHPAFGVHRRLPGAAARGAVRGLTGE
ncbi:hypothetical protein FHS29_005244 [Saccharothrix tamanrassetensis]|uniref:Uncharacterized protein n=1 Tax=Saccharothrix tamanrassetensis TaxID=1051531 RepID=A0A841CT72_9PSEU|nr:hypothetical protein [Saccharothrix tamanrassetensis]MBB5958636.1 hypothetical protein [Saccharothrix tamanrassetensis]